MISAAMHQDLALQAATALRDADALLITAGAGLGVDSGLPDFRSAEGFWNAYPHYRAIGLSLRDIARPSTFDADPALAWGFYGHRLQLYRSASPHAGFEMLRRWSLSKTLPTFVFTSNVDGHFQRAGFNPDRLVECHGSLNHFQCTRRCWPGAVHELDFPLVVDPATMRAAEPLPRCARCGALARPNILLFDDPAWDSTRTEAQEDRFTRWFASLDGATLAVIECGAGTAIPVIRRVGERLVARNGARLIRINPSDATVPFGQISVPYRARDALSAIDRSLRDAAPP